jgi:fimbrial isopeptide formation D2 family protein/uncharacterized repeat protein (TIGR01451 family)
MKQFHRTFVLFLPQRAAVILLLFLCFLVFGVQGPTYAQTNDGQLVGSGSFGDEPLVGAVVPFTITVTNEPSPPPGVFFEDRLYNVSAEVTLPFGTVLDSCDQEPSSQSGGILQFDNIQNLEVNQSLSITCFILLTDLIPLGTPFSVIYEWTSNTLPDNSGQDRDTGLLSFDAVPQAFDLEKEVTVTTGQYQVGGAGAWADGNDGIPVDWPYQYTLTLTNNGLNDSKGLQIIDIVPPGVAYLGVDSFSCTTLGTPATLEPNSVVLSDGSSVTIDGQSVPTVDGDLILTWDLDTLFGSPVSLVPDEVCTIIYNAGIPYRYRTSADTSQLPPLPADPLATGVGEFTGAILPHPASHENRYNATGIYDPDPLDPTDDVESGDGVVSTPLDDANVVTPSGYNSIAKDVDTDTVLQDEVVEYTVNGWISEYYNFTPSPANPYVITDILPDGLDFCGISRPVGSTPPAYGANGFYGDPSGCPSVIQATFNGSPLNPVSVVQDADFNLVITWHVTDPAVVQASDTWTLTYTAAIRDFYENQIERSNPDPATQYWQIDGGQPVSGLDVRNNEVDACGDWEDRIDTGRIGEDACSNAGTSISLEAPDIDKKIYDPDTNTFLDYNDDRVLLEIGETYTYRLLLSFPNDLDMRNVVIDDYLPRGHYYVPGSDRFTDIPLGGVTLSEDALTTPFPGAPQSAPGADYVGNQYAAEEFQDMGDFLINECPPGAGRPAGDPADPFYTTLRVIDDMNPASINLQNIVWYLCRVDNSDNPDDSDILWVVVFDALIVDDPAIVNNPDILGDGVRVANYGHLSGTSSFGVTYTLRDSLNISYVAPNLVVRKTNTADNPHNAADPYSYTINVTNTARGTAYDWIIRDAIPEGVRIPVSSGNACQGFITDAPGDFTCEVDAGAQAGTGGFVIITPVDGGGAHDPTREIESLDSYNFTFDAESGGLTPGETLTNTASVEYCTQPTVASTFDHDNNAGTAELPARNCIGYLDDGDPETAPTSFHSDEGAPPTYQDFVDYVDSDDTASNGSESNNTDNSDVTFALVELDKTHTPPTHTSPQVTTGDFATIGEAYTVTLEVTIPRRTQLFVTEDGYIEILDTIEQEGVVFCDASSGLPGCANPTLNNTQGVVTPFEATWWTADNSPNPGSTVQFRLNEIINFDLGSTDDDDEIVFNITFTMFVTGEDDSGDPAFFLPEPDDEAVNSFAITYRNDDPTPETFTATSNDDQIDIDQPYIQTDKEATDATNGFPVQGGDVVDYESVFTNTGESTAFEVTIIDQLPLFVTYNNDMVCTSSVGVSADNSDVTITDPSIDTDYSVDLLIDPGGTWDIPPGGTITCNYTVTVDLDVPAGTDLTNFTDADWSTLQGADPNERLFDDDPDDNTPDAADDDEDTAIVPVEQPTLDKTRTSPYNGQSPAPVRIGDVVTYQIDVPLPIGTTRSLIVSDFLEPGLIYRDGTTPTIVNEDGDPLSFTTTLIGSNDGLDNDPDPFQIDWAINDPACTTFAPCIFNNGVDNISLRITFQAVVADVPLNVHGLVLNNTVEASYIDGLDNDRVVTVENEPFDDEDVRVVEPVMTLVKTVDATTADAGDTFTYEVVLTNSQTPDPIDPTQPTAYDVTWEDVLDIHLEYVNGTMSCDVPTATVSTSINAEGNQVLLVTGGSPNAWDVAPGDSITCEYDVLVRQSVPPGVDLVNFADVDWSSLDGDVTGSATEPNERIYDGDTDNDGVEDVLGDGDDDSTTVPVPDLVLNKVVLTTDPNYQADNQYQPGQLVPYQITVRLPEGTTESLTVRDVFDSANVEFDSQVSVTSVPAGVSLASGPTVVSGNTIEWVFNDIVGTPDTFPTPPVTGYQITIVYYMRVLDTSTTNIAQDVPNTVRALHDLDDDDVVDPATQVQFGPVNIRVERPNLNVTKSADDTIVDAGDEVEYTIRIENNQSVASARVAYDAYMDDDLSPFVDYVPGSMTCVFSDDSAGTITPISFQLADRAVSATTDILGSETAALDQFRVSGNVGDENANGWDLFPADYIECTYRGIVLSTVRAGDPLVLNTVDGVIDSANGLQDEEIERTDEDDVPLTVPAPTIAKAVDTSAGEYQADGVYQPGEFVPWVITVTLPEGRTNSLVVNDTLPAGFTYVSGAVAFDAPTTGSFNLTGSPAAGATGAISWTFSTVDVTASTISPDPITDTLSIRFLTRVTGSAPTGIATNATSGTYVPPGSPATSIGTDDATVEVTRPSIDVNKRATDAAGNDITTVDAQNQVRYEVTIRNDGPGQAFDAYFTDDLDADTNFVPGSLDCRIADASIPDPVDFSTLPAITFVTNPDPLLATTDSFYVAGSLTEGANGWDLPDAGDRIICEYFVSIDDAAISGTDDITNDVTGGFDSYDNDDESPATTPDPFEQNFTEDDDVTVSIPDPTISKTTPTVDPYQPGDTIPYEVVVTIPEGVTNGLIVEDQLPTGLVFIDLSEAPSSAWDAGTFAVPGDITQSYNTGTNVVRWTFNAPVNNTPDNDATNNTITFRYTVRVTGSAFTAGVDALDDVTNTARVLFTPPGGDPETEADTDTAQVDLQRPSIAVTKAVSPTGTVDAGDTLTYTVTITNDGPGIAYDIFFTDTLDPATNYVPGSMSCAAPGFASTAFVIDDLSTVTVEDVRTTATDALEAFRVAQGLTESTNGWVLDVDESVVCTYDVTVNDYQDTIPVFSGDTDITNDVTGNFDSFDGDDETPATDADPFEENYSAADDVTNTVPPPTFDKTRTSADDAVQFGEIVSYQVVVTVPEGNIGGLRVTDTLPTGFEIIPASVSVTAGWGAFPALPSQTISATGNTLDITFDDAVENPGDNNAANNTITIAYNARVTTSAGTTPLPLSNSPATDAANIAEVFYTPSGATVPVSLGTDRAFVDVVAPEIAVTKAIIDSSDTVIDNGVTDAGDTVTYQITVTNTSTVATLFDVRLSDMRDSFLTLNTGSFSCSIDGGLATGVEQTSTATTFSIAEDLTEGDNDWDLAPGSVLTCEYTMTVGAAVPSGQLLENTITATGDTANGDQPNEQDLNDDDSAEIRTAAPQLTSKDVDATSANYQADGIYAVDELVPYVVTIRIPEGAVNNLEFVDVVPAGLALETTIAPVVSGGLTLAGAPTIDSGPGDGSAETTYRYTFTSPAQVASSNNTDLLGYNDVDYVDITVRYVARVTADFTTDTLINTATGEYNPAESALTNVPIGTDPASITVDSPALSLNKTGAPLLVDAGDVVTYTVTVENTSSVTAYDVFIVDNLDGFTTYAGNLTCAVDNVPDASDVFIPVTVLASGTDPITIDTNPAGGIDLQPDLDGEGRGNPGGRLTCSYDVTVDADVPATTTLVNSATATTSTQNGDQGANEQTITTPPDSQEVNTFAPQISKTFATGNPNYQADNTYAPGQFVPYQVTIRIPEGVALDLQFTDIIPAGLVYNSVVSVTGGPTLTGTSPSLTAGPGDGSAASTYLFAFNSPAQVANANNTGSIDYVDVVVTYLARVVIQTEGASLVNSMRGTYDTGNGANDVEIGTGSVTVTTELPQIETVKSITRVAPDSSSALVAYVPGTPVEAGNIVEYEVTVTNTDTSATLYDVVLSENPDADVSFNAGSVSCTLGGAVVTPDTDNADPFTIAGGASEAANTWDLAPGASVTCTYTVTVEAMAAAGSTLDNTVTGTGDSANGDQPSEITLNDDDSETIPVAAPEIRLRVVNPTDPASLPLVTIGRQAEYVITITLPAGTTSDLDVTTILQGDLTDADGDPIDLEYVSTVSITRGATDLSGDVTVDASGTTGGERAIVWSFGSPIVYDPAASGTNAVETIEIRFRALVSDVANNNDGDILDSSVSMTYSPDGGTTTLTVPEAADSLTDQDIQIAVPALVVDKTEDDVNNLVNPGQIVTYTITVSNVGTGLARNLVVDDLLPENWTYVAGTSLLNGTPISDPVITNSGRQLTWTLDTDPSIATDPVLNGVGSLTIVYQALVPATISGGPFDNFAQARGNDGISVSDPIANPIPEDNTDHVAGDTDPTDDALTSLNAAAAIEGLVWNDRNANGIIDSGEDPIIGVPITLYRVESDGSETLVTSTTTSATPITFNGVTYPAGSYLFSDLPPGDYVVVESQSGPILNWESTFDADTGTGGTEADRNRIVVTGLTGGELRNDRDFGDRVAGKVQGFVYLDPNGNGTNALPPDGGDTGFTPVTVTLTGVLEDGVTPYSDTVTTDSNGFYQFVNVPDGTFSVTVDDNAAVIQAVANIDFTPGAVGMVNGLVVNSDAPTPVIPEAHFPFRAPVALTVIKNGYNLGTPPLDVGDSIGWIVCATNTDALPADITVNDNVDTDRLTLVPGSIRAGVSALATCPSSVADLASLTLGAVADTNTISVTFNDVPAGDHVVLYFETTVNDPALWENGGSWLGVLSLALYHVLMRARQRRWARAAGQVFAALLLVALLGGVFVTVNAVLSQEATEETPTEESAVENEGESADDADSTPESTDAPQPTAAETAESTDVATPLVTAEPTSATTETPTAEATAEATAVVTAEPTQEATAEVTAEATATLEVTETVDAASTVMSGRVFDDANANLVQDEDEGGLPDIEVVIYDDGEVVERAFTDENGDYTFENLPTGDYQVAVDEESLPEDYIDVTAPDGQEPSAPAVSIEEPPTEAEAEATDEAGDSVIEVESPSFAFARDTDGDHAPDGLEGTGDRDNDGIPNYLDPFDPSGVLYIDQTGNPIADIEIALYADDGDGVLDTGLDALAATLQQNPQTTGTDGAYRFDIRTNVAVPQAGDPIVDGLPEDGSVRRFFLVVNTTNLPENITFPSLLVTDSGIFDASPDADSGQIVPLSIAPNPPIEPSTHRFFLTFDLQTGDDDVVNNHVAFGSETIIIDGLAVANVASASRPELPAVTAEARLPINSALDFTLVPNNYALLEPGETVTHGHTLTNTGQQTDSYTLTIPAGTQGWEQSVEIIRGGGLVTTITPGPGGTFTIPDVAPGEEITINHIITVPPGTITATIDTTSITAVSVTDENLVRNVTDITEVLAACFEATIYNDTNQNGTQDGDEPGIPDVRLLIYDDTNTVVAMLMSAGDGSYDLGGLASGNYRAEVDLTSLPAGTPLFVPDPDAGVQQFTFTASTDCSVGTFGLVLFDPALVKTGRPENARVGDVITFNITVSNNSTTQITNVQVVDPLSSYLDFISASGIDASLISFDAGTNSVIFNIGTMSAGQVLDLVVIAEVNSSAPQPGTVVNRAIFTYEEGEQQTRDTSVRIQPPPSDDDDDDNGGGSANPTPQPGNPTQQPAAGTPVVPPAVAQAVVPGAPAVGGAGGGLVPEEFPSVLPQTGEPVQTPLLVAVFVAGVVTALVFAGLVSLSGLFLRKWIVRSLRGNLGRLIGGSMLLLAISMGAGWLAFSAMLVVPAALDNGAEVVQNVDHVESEVSTSVEPRPDNNAVVSEPEIAEESETVSLDEWNAQFAPADVPATRIVIPALNIDTDLTQALISDGVWDVSTFHNEIAHLEGTAFPGTRGNAVLAGHVTHALGIGPFNNLHQLSAGDVIIAYGDGVEYRYVVDFVRHAEPDEIAYTHPTFEPGRFLTLITCAGWDQTSQMYTQRVVVRAQEATRS